MKGYLNDKEVKSAFYIEKYEDGIRSHNGKGSREEVITLILDTLSVLLFMYRKDGKTNEEVADCIKDYIIGTMNMADTAMKEGVFDDLC